MGQLDHAASSHWQADIQVWPEAAIPGLYHDVEYFIDDIDERAKQSHTNVISGILYDTTESFDVYNGIFGMGLASDIYFKQKLVPFGEYVPMENYLRGLIDFFNLPNSIIRVGPLNNRTLNGKTSDQQEYKIAPFICYEIVYPNFVAEGARSAELLVTISNDAWFGDSIGPFQHFEMARMRALEHQKYLVRSTNTGISAIVDTRGDIQVIGTQFQQEIITGEVELRRGQTPFARFGSSVTYTICFIFIALSLLPLALPLFNDRQ